ncbi:MAG TPA: NAD(P)-binding domain-containing protein [Candidatus Binataceae bacterium]|nr:NAD(P)-binding domain-containing protein [Candidatus Binataceae bacterium]
MPARHSEVAIVGAGPYGLSLAAHLRARGISLRVFGEPMQVWRGQMPSGMLLKSEGFASNLYDPQSSMTLRRYCADRGLPYQDVGLPVPLATFVAYGLAFQQQFVPDLDPSRVDAITSAADGFELTTANRETFFARRVVVAAGISHFGWLPPLLSGHPAELVSHSSAHGGLSEFKHRRVAVIGGGASAVDLAALLHEGGAAEVTLITRRPALAFHEPPGGPRSLMRRLLEPRSGLGIGWRSWLCTYAPLIFHRAPADLRTRVVERHLGPAPGWFMKDRVIGRFPLLTGSTVSGLKLVDSKVHLEIEDQSARTTSITVDHVIGATGYRVDLDRLTFIKTPLRRRIRHAHGAPILNPNFETSVPGLFMIGIAAANSFGPLMRFACGAGFTARRLARRL